MKFEIFEILNLKQNQLKYNIMQTMMNRIDNEISEIKDLQKEEIASVAGAPQMENDPVVG